MLCHLVLTWVFIISDLVKIQVIYVQLLSLGGYIIINIYQWELLTYQTFQTENKLFIRIIWIYPCLHILHFGINKRILDRSCTEIGMKFKNQNESGLKCNIENLFLGKTEMENLGFWVTRDGVKNRKRCKQ